MPGWRKAKKVKKARAGLVGVVHTDDGTSIAQQDIPFRKNKTQAMPRLKQRLIKR